jgi:hypothetical protein
MRRRRPVAAPGLAVNGMPVSMTMLRTASPIPRSVILGLVPRTHGSTSPDVQGVPLRVHSHLCSELADRWILATSARLSGSACAGEGHALHSINMRPRPVCAARKQPGSLPLEIARECCGFSLRPPSTLAGGKDPGSPRRICAASGNAGGGDIVSPRRTNDASTSTINTLRTRPPAPTGQPCDKREDDIWGAMTPRPPLTPVTNKKT